MRRAARTDSNQPEIVHALEVVGATVLHLHMVGHGCPDLAVGFRGRNYMLEIKTPNGETTPAERTWLRCWRGQAYIVRSVDDALRVIGAVR